MDERKLGTPLDVERFVDALMPPIQDTPVVVPEVQYGFVCPDWAVQHWDPHECKILLCTDGTYAAVDHSVQATIYVGRTRGECSDFLFGTAMTRLPSD